MYGLNLVVVFALTTMTFILSNATFAQTKKEEDPGLNPTSGQSQLAPTDDEIAKSDETEAKVSQQESESADQQQDAEASTQDNESESVATKDEVEFRANQPGLVFHLVTSIDEVTESIIEYERLCGPPCTTELEPGDYRLAISHEMREPILIEKAIPISESTVVEGVYRSYTPERMAGWIILGVGMIVGIGSAVPGIGYLTNDNDQDDEFGWWILGGGGVTFALSAIIGGVLAGKTDQADAFPMLKPANTP